MGHSYFLEPAPGTHIGDRLGSISESRLTLVGIEYPICVTMDELVQPALAEPSGHLAVFTSGLFHSSYSFMSSKIH